MRRFFWWVSPCEQRDDIEHSIRAAGLKPFEGTGYPTLLRRAEVMPLPASGWEIRRIDRAEAERQMQTLQSVYGKQEWPEAQAEAPEGDSDAAGGD